MTSRYGWYECEPNMVSQQEDARDSETPSAPSRSYVVVACRAHNACDLNNLAPGDDGEPEVFASLKKCVASLASFGSGGGPPGKVVGDRFYLTEFGAGAYFRCVPRP